MCGFLRAALQGAALPSAFGPGFSYSTGERVAQWGREPPQAGGSDSGAQPLRATDGRGENLPLRRGGKPKAESRFSGESVCPGFGGLSVCLCTILPGRTHPLPVRVARCGAGPVPAGRPSRGADGWCSSHGAAGHRSALEEDAGVAKTWTSLIPPRKGRTNFDENAENSFTFKKIFPLSSTNKVP